MEQPFWKFTFLHCTGLPDFPCHIPPSDNLGSSYAVPSHPSDLSPWPPHTPNCGPENGSLLLEGHMWFQYRGILTPVFHHNILKPSMGHMAYSVQMMVVSLPLFHLHISHQAQSTVHSQTNISVKHPSDTAPQINALSPRDTHITHKKCTNTLSHAETPFYS